MAEAIIYPMRINRYLALKGLATRRGADQLIKLGLVRLAGRVAVLGDKVENVEVAVEVMKSKIASGKKPVYIAYYKPRGIIAHSPQDFEQSIDQISGFPGTFPIGRLDKDSEGLILLTNDGRVTERLLHPRFKHEKEYKVTVREAIPLNLKKVLEEGVYNAGDWLKAKSVMVVPPHTMHIILTEGKKHHIRRMLSEAKLTVEKLIRTRVMDIYLGALKPGKARVLEGEARKAFLASIDLGEL
ncbi:MAG: pseudouridine synthase [Candidatus Moranbacteria bacterium]|nr:pseudouridine synthase [Candidatus Moranbacteria bacterium]